MTSLFHGSRAAPVERLWHAIAMASGAVLTALAMAGCATPNASQPTSTSAANRAPAKANPPTAAASGAPAAAKSAAAAAPSSADAASSVATGSGSNAGSDTDAYATPPEPIDPLAPDVKINLDDTASRADLWTRIRRGFAIPDLDSDLVREREQWYVQRPDYVARMTDRSSRYLFHIVEEVERRGLPTELALLPYIESAFNPQALSTAQASGMWQFIPSTGKDFELKQNMFRDDRRDVLASTKAALDYLARLHDQFGDWHLALAAYNWGEGSVQRAIARNQKLGLPTNYEALNMPSETRNYVPKLQAVKNIIARPNVYGISLPTLDNHPYFLTVPIERDIDVALVMRFAGMQADEFRTLNPQFNKPVILAAGTPQVLLPYDNAGQFVRNMASYRGSLASWTAWVAPRTLRTADAARIVGMDESTLREINRIPAKMLVKAGSTLLVHRNSRLQEDVSGHIADNATMSLAPDVPPAQRIVLRAGKHDTVASVARRWGVTPAQTAQWNRVRVNAAFRPGQSIVVYSTRARPAHGTQIVSSSQIEARKASVTQMRKAAAARAVAEAAAERTTAKHRPGKVVSKPEVKRVAYKNSAPATKGKHTGKQLAKSSTRSVASTHRPTREANNDHGRTRLAQGSSDTSDQ